MVVESELFRTGTGDSTAARERARLSDKLHAAFDSGGKGLER